MCVCVCVCVCVCMRARAEQTPPHPHPSPPSPHLHPQPNALLRWTGIWTGAARACFRSHLAPFSQEDSRGLCPFQGPHGTVTCMTAVGEDELKPDHTVSPWAQRCVHTSPDKPRQVPPPRRARGAACPSQSVADITLEWHRPREHASVLCPRPPSWQPRRNRTKFLVFLAKLGSLAAPEHC